MAVTTAFDFGASERWIRTAPAGSALRQANLGDWLCRRDRHRGAVGSYYADVLAGEDDQLKRVLPASTIRAVVQRGVDVRPAHALISALVMS
jgi:hypothetical protein